MISFFCGQAILPRLIIHGVRPAGVLAAIPPPSRRYRALEIKKRNPVRGNWHISRSASIAAPHNPKLLPFLEIPPNLPKDDKF